MTNYWQGKAACAQYRPSRWDTDEPDPQALAICDACPVKDTCLQDALDRNETHGVRGGLTPNQRDALKRGRALPKAGPRRCRDCGNVFSPPHHLTRYCSADCLTRGRTALQRSYEARHREKRRERDAARPGSRHVARRRTAA